MSSTATFERKKAFYLCHVCSNCGASVLSPGGLRSRVAVSLTVTNGLTAEDGEKRAFAAMKKIEEEIIARAHTHRSINDIAPPPKDNIWTGQEYRDRSDKNIWTTTWIEPMDASCPCCSHIEPWQKLSPDEDDFSGLTEQNYPVLYDDFNRALLRMFLQQQMNSPETPESAADPHMIETLRVKALELRGRLSELEAQNSNADNLRLIQEYTVQWEQLKTERNSLGLGKTREIAALGSQMHDLEKKIEELKTGSDENSRRLAELKPALSMELKRTERILERIDPPTADPAVAESLKAEYQDLQAQINQLEDRYSNQDVFRLIQEYKTEWAQLKAKRNQINPGRSSEIKAVGLEMQALQAKIADLENKAEENRCQLEEQKQPISKKLREVTRKLNSGTYRGLTCVVSGRCIALC